MKALTILQPWISALVSGQKRYETRAWAPVYRGPLALHAGKSPRGCNGDTQGFSFGKILAIGQLIDCHPVSTLPLLSPEEYALGDFSPGRYAWDIIDIRILPTPMPVKGQQGLWTFPY